MRISSVIFYLCASISSCTILDAAVAFDKLGKDDQYSSSPKPSSRTHTDNHEVGQNSSNRSNGSIMPEDEKNEWRLPHRRVYEYDRRQERSNSRNMRYKTNHLNRNKRYEDGNYQDNDRQKRYTYESKYERSRKGFSDHYDRNMRDEYRYHRGYNCNTRDSIETRYGGYVDHKRYNDSYRCVHPEHKYHSSVGNQNDHTTIPSVELDAAKKVVIPNSVKHVEYPMSSGKPNIVSNEIAKESEISSKREDIERELTTMDREEARLLKIKLPSKQIDDNSSMSGKAPKRPYLESEKVEKKDISVKTKIYRNRLPKEINADQKIKIVIDDKSYMNTLLNIKKEQLPQAQNQSKRNDKVTIIVTCQADVNEITDLKNKFCNYIRATNCQFESVKFDQNSHRRSDIIRSCIDKTRHQTVIFKNIKHYNVKEIGNGFLDRCTDGFKRLFDDANVIVLPNELEILGYNAFGDKEWKQGSVTIVMPSTIQKIAKDAFHKKHCLLPAIKWTKPQPPSPKDVQKFVDMMKSAGRKPTDKNPNLFIFVDDDFKILWKVDKGGRITKAA